MSTPATDPSSGEDKNPQSLAIEYPQAGAAEPEPAEEVHTLDVGQGNVVKLDRLGPMIVNSDGVSRSPRLFCWNLLTSSRRYHGYQTGTS
jgi:hypothetical protein